MLSFGEKYSAIVRKDSTYEGLFITAVTTTGIFCRPVCTARKPKPENVVFYNTVKEALQHGYRPCKVCKPLLAAGITPEPIQQRLQELQQNPFVRLKDWDLRQRKLEPSQVRRWFQKNWGLSFHAYQRMLRINGAYHKIKSGDSVTSAAFESGYESMSGFEEGFQSIFGVSPKQANGKTIINIMRFTSPLGPLFACATAEGICLLEFTDRKMLETEFKDLCKRLNAVILPGTNKHLEKLQVELQEYFKGNRQQFTLAMHTPGTLFQQQVWEVLKQIPYGETRSYKQQALAMGQPTAMRAVAAANGHNRLSILIPCHRVIGENGTLTGYGGGLDRKRWLLEHEASTAGKQKQLRLDI